MWGLFGPRGRRCLGYNEISWTQVTTLTFQYVHPLEILESGGKSGLVERLDVASERPVFVFIRR